MSSADVADNESPIRFSSREEIFSLFEDERFRNFIERHVSSFVVTLLPPDLADNPDSRYYLVNVEKRGPFRWAVSDRFQQYDINCVAVHEALPSSRDEDFIKNYRHDLLTAVDLAFRVAEIINVNGWTVDRFVERERQRA